MKRQNRALPGVGATLLGALIISSSESDDGVAAGLIVTSIGPASLADDKTMEYIADGISKIKDCELPTAKARWLRKTNINYDYQPSRYPTYEY